MEVVVVGRKSKALAGLDNIAASGAVAFAELKQTVQSMEDHGLDKNTVNEMQQRLDGCKSYLTGAYVEHVMEENGSQCPDHCAFLALSDPADSRLQIKCEHEHVHGCADCEDITETVDELRIKVDELTFTEEERADLLFDISTSGDKILMWKAHILRSHQQDQARFHALDQLNEETGLLIFDWAMKIVPRKHRESMKEWFGKRGLSLFGAVLLLKKAGTNETQKFSYMVFLESCSQNADSVMAVHSYILKQVKKDFPMMEQLYEKCDNAGCFHNSEFLSYKRALKQEVGIEILRTDFNDPYCGKDQCDRDFAVLKSQLNIQLNAGYNLEHATELKQALESSPRKIKGMKYAVVEILEQQGGKKRPKEAQPEAIGKFHSFEFTGDGAIGWRYFGIGQGVPMSFKQLDKSFLPELKVISDFSSDPVLPGAVQRVDKNRTEDIESPIVWLPCEEPGCTLVFSTEEEQENHMLFETHSFQLQKESQFDILKRAYIGKLQLEAPPVRGLSTFSSELMPQHTTEMGHALPKRSGGGRHLPKQIEFLKRGFEAGIIARKERVTGESIASQMRLARDENGVKIFQPNEYLTEDQCRSYLSRTFTNMKKGKYTCLMKEAAEVIQELYRIGSQQEGPSPEEIETDTNPDADLEQAVADDLELQGEISLIEGTMAVEKNDWIAYFCADDPSWTIGKVVECDHSWRSTSETYAQNF